MGWQKIEYAGLVVPIIIVNMHSRISCDHQVVLQYFLVVTLKRKYLYFIDGAGNVSRKPKSGEGQTEVLVSKAIERDNQFLYFVDKEGDVARSPRATRRTPKKVA